MGDGNTNVNNPLFSGLGDAGDTVTLTIQNVDYPDLAAIQKQVIVSDDGTWQIRLDDGENPDGSDDGEYDGTLADGSYSYTLNATDVAGNSVTTAATPLLIDTQNPTPLTGSLDATSDLVSDADGQLSKIQAIKGDYTDNDLDGITRDTTPLLSGTVDADNIESVVVFLDDPSNSTPITAELDRDADGKLVVTTDVNGNKVVAWSLQLDAQTSGEHTFTAVATDKAGNQSTLSEQSFTIDQQTLAPTGELLSEASDSGVKGDLITKVLTPIFSGGAASAEAGSILLLEINNHKYETTAEADGSWTISVTDALPSDVSDQSFTLTQIDVAGNTASVTNTLTVDTETQVTAHLQTEADFTDVPVGFVSSDSGVQGDNYTNMASPTFTW